MPSSSKRKGNRFEREIVELAEDFGLKAKRAYASNGRSLGEAEDVDVKIEDWTVQAKRRKAISDLYKPVGNAHIQIFRADREPAYVSIMLEDFLELLKKIKDAGL